MAKVAGPSNSTWCRRCGGMTWDPPGADCVGPIGPSSNTKRRLPSGPADGPTPRAATWCARSRPPGWFDPSNTSVVRPAQASGSLDRRVALPCPSSWRGVATPGLGRSAARSVTSLDGVPVERSCRHAGGPPTGTQTTEISVSEPTTAPTYATALAGASIRPTRKRGSPRSTRCSKGHRSPAGGLHRRRRHGPAALQPDNLRALPTRLASRPGTVHPARTQHHVRTWPGTSIGRRRAGPRHRQRPALTDLERGVTSLELP